MSVDSIIRLPKRAALILLLVMGAPRSAVRRTRGMSVDELAFFCRALFDMGALGHTTFVDDSLCCLVMANLKNVPCDN